MSRDKGAKTGKRKIKDLLGKLAAEGSTRQIADHLADLGMRGQRDLAHRCPVAHYLGTATGATVIVTTSDVICLSPRLCVRLPDLIADFVAEFDAGRFPQLDGAA